MGHGFGSFVAVLIAVAVCVFAYMVLAKKGPFKDKPSRSAPPPNPSTPPKVGGGRSRSQSK
jgi:hypothetical protein